MTGKSREVSVRLSTLQRLTPDVWQLRFAIGAQDDFHFEAGQHAKLEFPEVGVRDFSIASTPAEAAGERSVEFHIRAIHGGSFASLLDRGLIAPGVELKMRGPYGSSFLMTDAQRDVLLLAGGSGMAPMLSIARTAIDRGLNAPLRLLIGVRTEAEVYAEDLLSKLHERESRFTFEFVLSTQATSQHRRIGLVTDVLRQDYADMRGMRVHLAGPPAMLGATIILLRELGVADADIHADGHIAPPAQHVSG
jgi:CDP-4-dehydro-6-deoxyglucose reductase/ferredoxin-NAD(P)+ reductase (naphthalene dioxygenase ferredoxin-specific)